MTIFPHQCLLCDLPSDNQRAICKYCYNTLPVTQNNASDCFSLFEYAEPISSLIIKLKFHGDLSIAHWLSQCWIDRLPHFYGNRTWPDRILPVPLHPKRLKERGFNQALEIAKPVGKYFGIPIDIKTCIRIKNTKAQSSLSGKDRAQNMKNAFGLSYSISAKKIAILDDVMTTGSTLNEIRALFQKNEVETDVWCCARVLH